MKKIISTILAAAISLSAVGAAAFDDVAESDDCCSAAKRLSAFKIMDGYDDGTFKPDKAITRAEVAALFCRVLNLSRPLGLQPDLEYDDVPPGHWAYSYVAALRAETVIDGDDDNLYHPSETMTYRDFLKMTVSMLGYNYAAEDLGGYPDGYIAEAETLKLTNGISSEFSYTDPINRGDAAIIIANAVETPLCFVTAWDNVIQEGGEIISTPIYETDPNLTILSEYHDIYKVTAEGSDEETQTPTPSPTASPEDGTAALAELGIYDDDFPKSGNITRDVFAKYLRRLMPSDDTGYTPSGTVTDLDADDRAAYMLCDIGVLKTEDGMFKPDEETTLADALEAFLRILGAGKTYDEDCLLNSLGGMRLSAEQVLADNCECVNLLSDTGINGDNIAGNKLDADTFVSLLYNSLDLRVSVLSEYYADREYFGQNSSGRIKDRLTGTLKIYDDYCDKTELMSFSDVTPGIVNSAARVGEFKAAAGGLYGVAFSDCDPSASYFLTLKNKDTGETVFEKAGPIYSYFYFISLPDAEYEIYLTAAPSSKPVSGTIYSCVQ